jgi:electron transfer flavoprotein beta subunit
MLSAKLRWSQATFASEIDIQKDIVRVTREVDGGLQTIDAKIPAVVSVDLRLNEPRYASLPNIMKAKRKPLEEISPADLGVEITQRLKVIKTEEPGSREAGLILENIDQLVEKIQENVGG